MKIALEDTTLPTGGGASGKEPIAVLKDTQIGMYFLIKKKAHPPLHKLISS